MPFSRQIDATAYHVVLELDVVDDSEPISSEPCMIVRDGRIIGRNHFAVDVHEECLGPTRRSMRPKRGSRTAF